MECELNCKTVRTLISGVRLPCYEFHSKEYVSARAQQHATTDGEGDVQKMRSKILEWTENIFR